MKRLAVIRIRGRVNVRSQVEETLNMLRLRNVNNCVIIDDRKEYLGMLQKVKDYVTWGEVDPSTIEELLKNRGQLVGGRRFTEEHLEKNTKFKSIKEFAKAFSEFKAEFKDISGLKPVFRLHPPRKGHGRIKRGFAEGGALGARGEEIKEILSKMR